MPLQRRLPKRGFVSPTRDLKAEITLRALEQLALDEVDLLVLRQAGLVPQGALIVKIVATGTLTRKVTVKGVGATKGAKAAIEQAGGSVVES